MGLPDQSHSDAGITRIWTENNKKNIILPCDQHVVSNTDRIIPYGPGRGFTG